MIESRSLVRRYALALYQISEEQEKTERFSQDLAFVQDHLERYVELKQLLFHPRVRKAAKKDLIDKFLGPSIDRTVRNLLCLLIDRKRESVLQHLLEEFDLAADEASGLAHAELESVYPLGDTEMGQIRSQLERITGKTLDIEQRVNPEVLGGVRVRIGSSLIDGSVAAELKALREQLLEFKI